MRTLILILATAGAAFAQEITDEGDLCSCLEARYARAAEAAEKVTVAILVDREEEAKAPRPLRPGFGSMLTGGVFAKRPQGLPTSGTVVDAEGLILTTAFNVTGGKINSIKVILPDGSEREATVVGFHELYDVALLKVEAAGLATLKGADLDRLTFGSAVAAAGRAPDGKSLTINPGIFSAPGRDGGRTVQTDCKLNYGNVGGPLLDRDGNLIGVTCKVTKDNADQWGQNSGVSFAISYDKIREILPDLKRGIRVEQAKGAFLGIQGQDWEDGDGVVVNQAMGGTAAQKAGLQAGDIIVEFNGEKVKGMDQLRDLIMRRKIGDKVKVKFLRNAEEQEVEVALGERSGG